MMEQCPSIHPSFAFRFSSLFITLIRMSISCFNLPSLVNKTLRDLNMGKKLTPYPKLAIHPFLAENRGLRFRGDDPHSRIFTLCLKPPM